jgi:hypothetical protein
MIHGSNPFGSKDQLENVFLNEWSNLTFIVSDLDKNVIAVKKQNTNHISRRPASMRRTKPADHR